VCTEKNASATTSSIEGYKVRRETIYSWCTLMCVAQCKLHHLMKVILSLSFTDDKQLTATFLINGYNMPLIQLSGTVPEFRDLEKII